MLFLYTGTDREKARTAMGAALKSVAKSTEIIRISDANTAADLRSAIAGGGMFGDKRVVILDGVSANEEMHDVLFAALPQMSKSKELFFVLEEKPDAATRKHIEKYAEDPKRFDLPAGRQVRRENGTIFALANALRRGDKKALWVGYQRALLRDEAPEAIHGVLFWGAKDMFMKSNGADHTRAKKFLAELAELPHEARRRGFALEYALERYILGFNK